MKRVLVVHALTHRMRRTTVDFVMSFGRYTPAGVDVTYHNLSRPPGRDVRDLGFDALILPYDILSLRQAPRWNSLLEALIPFAEDADLVIAMPQDDYTYNGVLDSSLDALGTDVIYTPIESGLDIIYPSMSSKARIELALTGYVDEKSVAVLNEFRIPIEERSIDVGQRVRMLPAWFGRKGTQKGLFAERFAALSEGTVLDVDISTDHANVFSGDDWYRFLASCRATIGEKGGASLCDPDGSIMERVVNYIDGHQSATFDEIEAACFPGLDGVAVMTAISPRLFDAAIMHTAQVLVEDDYLGVMEPWVHYIPTDQDLSNFDEIVEAVTDTDLLVRITDAADQALIQSGQFTYRAFAERVLKGVGDHREGSAASSPVDLAEELQWRLTPELFEAVQRCAYLGNATGSLRRFAMLAEDVEALLTEQPALVNHFDYEIFRLVLGEVEIHPAVDRHAAVVIDVLGECFKAGATRSVVKWFRYMDTARVEDWKLLDWTDWPRIELDEAGAR